MSCSLEPWGLEFTAEEIAAARSRNGLLSLELELSRACNLGCIYCYASSGVPLRNELTMAEIKGVIDQARERGARKIVVLGGGEPLLYPRLFEVLDYILGQGLAADVFTNGALITPARARALYDRKIALVVKMNSRRAATQDYLAGQPGAFVQMQQGFNALRQAGYPDAEHKLGIGTVVCPQNIDELPQLWRWAKSQGIVPYIEMMTWQGRAQQHPELQIDSTEIKNLFETLAAIDAQEFGVCWTPHPPFAASHCARHEYSCTVTAAGDIHPCPGVSLTVGNIREKSLGQVLDASPVIAGLRNIRQTIKGRCADCALRLRCYGCRGHAFQVTGDYLAEDPMCWVSPI